MASYQPQGCGSMLRPVVLSFQLVPMDLSRFPRRISSFSYRTFATVRLWPNSVVPSNN